MLFSSYVTHSLALRDILNLISHSDTLYACLFFQKHQSQCQKSTAGRTSPRSLPDANTGYVSNGQRVELTAATTVNDTSAQLSSNGIDAIHGPGELLAMCCHDMSHRT